jgi:peptide-methionine (S)-S-oxide reductase
MKLRMLCLSVFASALSLLSLGCGEASARTVQDAAPTSRPGGAKSEKTAVASRPASSAPAQGDAKVMTQKATFGAGCFWGVEDRFRKTAGVVDAAVGYMGGQKEKPSYKEVCTDRTGHAEVVQVEFDPAKVSYEQLLEIFWKCHNPTQVNRQGPDVGSQYRSAIFFHSPEQEKTARESKEKLARSGKHRSPIATEITPAGEFWRAEEYHQRYLEKNGLSTCHVEGSD